MEPEQEEPIEAEEVEVRDLSHMKWYALGTLSGYENRAFKLLTENIRNSELGERFGEILVPTEEVVELRNGAKRKMQRKLMPGYMFVQMVLDQETWHVVKETQKIIGFIGDDKNPKPMSKREVGRLTAQQEEGTVRPKAKQTFEEGTTVRVVDGPFLNFSGTVEEVMPQKQKVRVLVSIFGRATPVELDFMQVERT
ncbi:MAG: transcriptional antiterminator NusG [Myxococcota bacterium]|jgi:transcriptional antiterminator NusG